MPILTSISSIWLFIVFFFGQTFAQQSYTPNYRDSQLLNLMQWVIDEYVEQWSKERIVTSLSVIKSAGQQVWDDEKSLFLLYEIEMMLEKALDDAIESHEKNWSWNQVNTYLRSSSRWWTFKPTWASSIEISENVWDDETETGIKAETETVEKDNSTKVISSQDSLEVGDVPWEIFIDPSLLPDPFLQRTHSDFVNSYQQFLQSDKPLYDSCFIYFDQIDLIAKEYNFPTALIIATRYREHSCFFSNPSNGRGNFQITSHDYPAWDITREQFSDQIINFISFSQAKRDWYDAIQVFGPEPVSLQYETFDLSSVRKHAILYNGVYPDVTLDSSWYANENFTQARWWRDGIVASFLKVLQWEMSR